MKFVIEPATKCAGRLGILTGIERIPDKSYKTPLLLFTDHNLSKEVLEISGFQNIAVLLSFDSSVQMTNALKLYKKGISEFIGLKECLTFVTIKNPSEQTISGHHEKGSLPVYKKSGKINVTPEDYMTFVKRAIPDFFVTLADGDTWIDCSKKRIIKSNERSNEMFDECIKYQQDFEVITSKMIGTIEGGYSDHERRKSIEHMKHHDDKIIGYFIDGLHRNGQEAVSLNSAKVNEIVKTILSMLPNDKVKMMFGAFLPHLVLELVSLGIDVFDSSFAILVTKLNRALTFNFNIQNPTFDNCPEIDLMDSKYKDDFSPFVESCECLACKQHTKAYTNHLLNTKELLGPMLLTIHNLHHYKKFFEAIHECMKNDKLSELKKMIDIQYNNRTLSYDVQKNAAQKK
ncbi:queuine tRNA-ribosyltransferase accessory subunit 2 [Chironomus tepperi]|uniref:queuine tRNA-ribosyltransferase accessory subunit 2 n=1 Tax=Chironomus tepperi TaxID=113505 RepID=UPI00391F2A67